MCSLCCEKAPLPEAPEEEVLQIAIPEESACCGAAGKGKAMAGHVEKSGHHGFDHGAKDDSARRALAENGFASRLCQ